MAAVSALSTELCYNRPALQNKYKTSPHLYQDSRDISGKQSTISTSSPLRLSLGQGRRQYSDTAKGPIVTREKEDDHALFDAAEAEAMTLVQQHQATYMSNGHDVKKDYLESNFPSTSPSPIRASGREGHTSESNSVPSHRAKGEIENIKQSRHTTETAQNEVDHANTKGSGYAGINPRTEQVKEAIPKAMGRNNSRQNPFQRARLHRPAQSTNTGSFVAPTSYGRDSNELPSLVRESRYISNSQTTLSENTEVDSTEEASQRYKNGVEIRSDEIRAATSMRLGDRSPRLPSPSYVSSSPKRPIVSFATGTMADNSKVSEKQQSVGQRSPLQPTVDRHLSTENYQDVVHNDTNRYHWTQQQDSVDDLTFKSRQQNNTIPIPTFQFSCDDDNTTVPKQVQDHANEMSTIPSIVVSGDEPEGHDDLPSKQECGRTARNKGHIGQNITPLPERRTSEAKVPSCSFSRFGALCNNCALPISGRIVSAAGHRFHPECFRCYHCGEGLECVAFYPEPESKREERLLRSFKDLNCREGTDSEMEINVDHDASMRFYCHLDYHEFFSPRCKSCKTPIEGEVVVACGAHWHVGHFFCAECGDPFESSTPFVERDGYAWCIRCHTNRQSAKCKRCKKPVTDLVVSALGSEWHNDCFSCSECGSQFENGVYFLRGSTEDPVCLKCEEIRLKA